jgi:hypothetical protein
MAQTCSTVVVCFILITGVFAAKDSAKAASACNAITSYLNEPDKFISERGTIIEDGTWETKPLIPGASCTLNESTSSRGTKSYDIHCSLDQGAETSVVKRNFGALQTEIDSCLSRRPDSAKWKREDGSDDSTGSDYIFSDWSYDGTSSEHWAVILKLRHNKRNNTSYNTLSVHYSKKSSTSPPAQAQLLNIAPAIQRSPVWCWVAVSEMIFKYYGAPNASPVGVWQCGIVGVVKPILDGRVDCNFNCGSCNNPAGDAEYFRRALEVYPVQMRSRTTISAYVRDYAIKPDAVKDNIDHDRPIVTGISPGNPESHFGASEHVALIVGYRNGGSVLFVNDPYPYWSFGLRPFEKARGRMTNQRGQYEISYDDFVNGLAWQETILLKPN